MEPLKPLKYDVGNFKENLRIYMYLYNTYGKPSEKDIDSFLTIFEDVIIYGNFHLVDYDKEDFDSLWSDIKDDLVDRMEESLAKEYGGWHFLMKLSDSVSKLNSREDIINFMKEYKIEETSESKEEYKETDINSDADSIYEKELTIVEDTVTVEEIKHTYRLIDYNDIGLQLTIIENIDKVKNEYKANILSETSIEISGKEININEFIEEVERRNGKLIIKLGKLHFEDVYTEDK